MATISNLNNSGEKRIRVLVAPLDWGLGHATRCIPIIKQLIALNCEVLIASSGGQKALLEQEFPALRSLELPGYGLKYGEKRWSTSLKIFLQIPKILTAIKRENCWLQAFLVRERLDMLISDNRYGLHSEGLFSIFITHQLCIQTPWGQTIFGKIAEKKLQKIHYRYIDRFSRCWVPDLETAPTLAGRLAHPELFPSIATRYIGILSRFRSEGKAASGEGKEQGRDQGKIEEKAERKTGIDILFLLSGPEPQRTLLEKRVVRELRSYTGKAVIVRGLPGNGGADLADSAGTPFYSHLPAAELKKLIDRSGLVISRAGYSTIMDLAALGKRAVLIPTPGQSEQEYLGDRLAGMHLFMCIRQNDFSLPDVLAAAGRFPFAGWETGGEGLLQEEILGILETVFPIGPPS